MLFNFCDPRLKPKIQCSTVSTEGYEITNLITGIDKGYLAYACINPPINIDVTFICDIRINHILIWPQVGSQKSSGFQLYAKTNKDASIPYILLGTGFLDTMHTGLLFCPSKHESIPAPANFLQCFTKSSTQYLTTCVNSLRICICKTQNSVPALGKIEVWGTVSPLCDKDIVASISTLWLKKSCLDESMEKPKNAEDKPPVTNTDNKKISESLEIPESFLDAITYEIMTQPILLPSGKIIDQTTLLKCEETEAKWGRNLTDPFTGLSFSEDRKPVIASALKIKIDRFLLENCNNEEIKKLPRVLGRALPSDGNVTDKTVMEVPNYLLQRNTIQAPSDIKPKFHCSIVSSVKAEKKLCHKLPVVVMSQKRTTSALPKPVKKKVITNSYTSTIPLSKSTEGEQKNNCIDVVDLTVDSKTDFDINTAVPNLKRFNNIPNKNETNSRLTTCSCCPNGIFYQLPCKHVVCRKVLTSIENNQCISCSMPYKNHEVERIYE